MKPNTQNPIPKNIILFTLSFLSRRSNILLAVLCVGGLLYPFSFLSADTIIDSVYSDSLLDGEINFSQNAQGYIINNWMYDMFFGDHCGNYINPDPNSYIRSYISFYLPVIPEGYHIDSVYVRLYQYGSGGYDSSTGAYTDFPVWNVAGGDTIKCIMSHINYGNELDIGDWEKGDVGNPNTYQNNIGTITESGIDGYRYLDVTASVIQDYELNRDKTQYRIAFQIDTDWENGGDLVAFITGNPPIDEYTPIIYIIFTDEVNSIGNEEIQIEQTLNIEIYPNPVRNILEVSLSRRDVIIRNLDIYNIKGQKVKFLYDFKITRENNIMLDGSSQPSGIYLMKIITGKEMAVKKFLIVH